ncbi:MAG TPA: (2Fe-2S)-binding protein, partial [Anaerolineales bacterium]|nr:(2Fe-2S)-binding protein [Anaerolineales bacterium]
MRLRLTLNGKRVSAVVPADATLLEVLRQEFGVFSVKQGCETGECGACTVLLNGEPVNACVLLAMQVEGKEITTIEAIGQHPEQGWKLTAGLDPLQQAFVETGAIQCGYCTPAMILAARALLTENPEPSEADVREALSGVLCRCTGYLKPVQAILRAAAVLRGEEVPPIDGYLGHAVDLGGEDLPPPEPGPDVAPDILTRTGIMPQIRVATDTRAWSSVGRPEPKVDAVKLAQGKPAFA